METVIDVKYENPYIQVIWEDNVENFTQEKIKSVKEYFQKKYKTTNVNIITKNNNVKEITSNVDVSFNIMDNNYQIKLMEEFMKIKYPDSKKDFDEIIRLDNDVNNEMLLKNNDVTPFKKWYIKNIEFSNFLSYGENQKLDFEKYDGISVIESNPKNFGGKCVRENTLIDVEFDESYILDKLGFIPDELKL